MSITRASLSSILATGSDRFLFFIPFFDPTNTLLTTRLYTYIQTHAYSSTCRHIIKMIAEFYTETSVSAQTTTRCHNSQDITIIIPRYLLQGTNTRTSLIFIIFAFRKRKFVRNETPFTLTAIVVPDGVN
jgi:hypothetical protein